jgi:hypothetical protein
LAFAFDVEQLIDEEEDSQASSFTSAAVSPTRYNILANAYSIKRRIKSSSVKILVFLLLRQKGSRESFCLCLGSIPFILTAVLGEMARGGGGKVQVPPTAI